MSIINNVIGTNIYIDDSNGDKIVDIKMQGNTSQATTTGKNLFIPTLKVDDTNISTIRCSVTLSGDEYTFSATGSDCYFGNIVGTGNVYNKVLGTLYDVEGITNLVFKPTNSAFDKNYVCYYDNNKVSLGYVQIDNNTGLITPIANTKYIGFRIGINNSVSGTNYTTKIQLEKGSTATEFEPYTNGASPNPEYPQDIQVVSGDNDINVVGKNLFTLKNISNNTVFGIERTINNSILTLNGTTTGSGQVIGRQTTSIVLPSGTYNISVKRSSGTITSNDKQAAFYFRKPSGTEIRAFLINNFSNTTYSYSSSFTLTESTELYVEIYCNGTGYVLDNLTLQFQIEKGSSASDFEQYVGNTYSINLPNGMELCKIGNYQDVIKKSTGKNFITFKNFNEVTQNGITTTPNNSELKLNGTVTQANPMFNSQSLDLTLPKGTYTITYKIASGSVTRPSGDVAFYLRNGTTNIATVTIYQILSNNNTFSQTFTIDNNASLYFYAYSNVGNIVFNNTVLQIQLEKGTQSTSFEPYGTGWYVKKETGRFYSNSTTGWSYDNNHRYYRAIDNIVVPPNNDTVGQGFCNVGLVTANQTLQASTTPGLAIHPISRLYISEVVYNNIPTTPIVLYYALVNPIYTEITDSTLIDQLNDIDNALLPYGIVHIAVSSDNLPSILSIDYFTQDRYINTSDRYALINNTATIPFKINIIKDGIVIKTLDEYSIINIDYEDFRYVDTSSLVIGQFVARKISGTLDKIYTDFEIEDTELNIQMGVCVNDNTNYYDLGNFLVTKPTNNDVKDKTSFEAMDYTKKFNTPFTDTGLTFPCTALQLAQHTCNLCGVELATTNFDNYDFEIPNNQYTEGDTCRKVMQDIGKLAYSWVRIDWDNKCYIDFDPQDYIVDTNKITNQNYYDLSLQNNVFGPVNRVVVGIKDVEGENAVIEDSDSIAQYGVTEIQLYDSNITYTPELRQQAISKASKLFGLIYTPLESNTTGHPWLIGKEKIQFTTMDGDIKYTYPFDRTIAYNGHIKSKLTSKADTKTETEYRNYGNLETATRQTRIIVDKQNQVIEALAEQVKPISNEISGAGNITLENAYVGTLHRLEITGEISCLLPKDTLLPSNTLYPFEIILDVDGTKYVLGIDYLHYTNSTNHDTYIYEDGRQWIERADGTIEDFGEIFITIDRSSVLTLDNLNTATLKAIYLLENEWTDTFAPTIDLVSKINLAPGLATIAANKIKLEGYTTINENFGVDLQGNMWARNGSFSGNIYLEDGNKILGGDGLYSCLAFTNTGRFSGWDILGYWASGLNVSAGPASYSDSYITAYIPKNFVVDKAYLVLQTSSMYSAYSDASGDHDVVGYPKQLKLFKGDSGTTVSFFYYPYQAVDEYTEYSGTEIQNAFGESAYTPDINYPGAINEKVTIDFSNYVSEGMNTFFVRSTITPRPQIKTYTPSGSSYSAFDYSEVVLNTGIAKLNLYVFGYMSVSEEE